MTTEREVDVLVVGAGPGGIAAACAAAEAGHQVLVVDDNRAPGGQIWRGGPPQARRWLHRFRNPRIQLLSDTSVFACTSDRILLAAQGNEVYQLRGRRLILATGARERFLPFPGWTLPNVTGAGGLQALVKGGLPIAGRRVIVAGTGPLLVAVAAYLRAQGADVPLIAEQTDSSKLARFSGALMRYPRKLVQALSLRMKLLGTRYLTSCWPVRAEGDGKIETVTLRRGQRLWPEPCDYLACGFGLVPNLDLPLLLGCKIRNGFVTVGDDVATSLPGVYAVGELTGIAGVDKAIYEGRTGRGYPRHFEQMLAEAFELRPELKELATPDTIVCRCEDVPMASLRPEHNWRSAKLQTRCGMGPCQGRVCGPAVEFLLGWSLESVRPPILPTRIDALQ